MKKYLTLSSNLSATFFPTSTSRVQDKLYKAFEIIPKTHKNLYLFYDQRWTIKIFAWPRSVSHTLAEDRVVLRVYMHSSDHVVFNVCHLSGIASRRHTS